MKVWRKVTNNKSPPYTRAKQVDSDQFNTSKRRIFTGVQFYTQYFNNETSTKVV